MEKIVKAYEFNLSDFLNKVNRIVNKTETNRVNRIVIKFANYLLDHAEELAEEMEMYLEKIEILPLTHQDTQIKLYGDVYLDFIVNNKQRFTLELGRTLADILDCDEFVYDFLNYDKLIVYSKEWLKW